jgi:N-methylhydantoinase A
LTVLTAPRSLRVAVDVGGPFTDLQILDERTGQTFAAKTPTTPADPSEGLITGLREAGARFGFTAADVSALMHGTTIGTNAVLQRRLPKGGLITTFGFEDVLEIGRHFRRDVYANRAEPRALLIPRALRLGVRERTRANGEIEADLDTGHLAEITAKLRAADVRAVAVCLLHAYANAKHERAVGAYLAKNAPEMDVALSHEVSPEIREFERSSTTVLNALLMPVVRGYLERLRARLAEAGFKAPVYLVQSNGGVTSPETAALQPARLLLSGPSGGALAAETISARLDIPNLVAVDMGGTSYDVSIVHAGRTRQITEGKVDGLPVRLPMIDIRTIGAGGGSIARVEGSGRLRVGPASAGARPGPVCYRRGGTEPTVTDANVTLGRIDPNFFLGGSMDLDAEGARAAISEKVAGPLGLTAEAAAEGVSEVAVSQMAGAIRLSLFEKGLDPEDFALLSFGGASGLHACETAKEIGIDRVVFPNDPGTLSAWGMLYSDVVHSLTRSRLMKADAAAPPVLGGLCASLMSEARAVLERDGVAEDAQSFPLFLDMRYPGQAYEIQVPLEGPAHLAAAVARFHDLHMAQYAHAERHVTPEIVAVRLAATGRLKKPVQRPFKGSDGGKAKSMRRAFAAGGWQETPVWDRAAIGPGNDLRGPLIVEEEHATHAIPKGWTLRVTATGDLIASRTAEAAS